MTKIKVSRLKDRPPRCYEDDLTSNLRKMLNICKDYAKDYSELFNGPKSKLLHFEKK